MKALVLSGGASKGAYQLGVLRKWMGEDNKDYEIMTGVSVGALNVSGLAKTPFGSPKESIDWMVNFWLEHVETKNVYKRWFPFGRLHALWEKSVYNSAPLVELVKSTFDQEKIINSGRKLAVGAVCLDTGEHRFVRETDPNFVEWVLASASFPVFLGPVSIEGKLWSDGGIKNVTPLGQAIRMGATDIDVILTSNAWDDIGTWSSTSKRAIPDQALRVVSLMNDQIVKNDLRIAGLKNDLAQLGEPYKNIKIRMVMPTQSLVADSLKFDKDEIRRMLDIGYNDAVSNLVEYV